MMRGVAATRHMTVRRFHPLLLAAVVATAPLGCALKSATPPSFSNERYSRGPGYPASLQPKILAQGFASQRWHVPTVLLRLENRGTTSARLGYVMDTYVANTRDGRSFVLEKDFLKYPSHLGPDEEVTVILFLPKDLSLNDVTSLTATIDDGRTVLKLRSARGRVLSPAQESAPLAFVFSDMNTLPKRDADSTVSIAIDAPRTIAGTGAAPANAFLIAPPPPQDAEGSTQTQDATAPSAEDKTAAEVTSADEPETVSAPEAVERVPVIVEFTQELGASLKLDVSWNDEPDVVRLRTGQKQTFDVLPDRYDLRFACHMPPFTPTTGSIPLMASAKVPIRVTFDAIAHPDGAEILARVWYKKRKVWDHRFKPPR